MKPALIITALIMLAACGADDGSNLPAPTPKLNDAGIPANQRGSLSLNTPRLPWNQVEDFTLPLPTDTLSRRSLWATWYYLPVVNAITNGYALRNVAGDRLGPTLALRDWCRSAMEGSVAVTLVSGELAVYNYGGTSTSYRVDCSSIYSHDVSKTKFKISRGQFGEGVQSYRLRPYRSIATDKTVIPWGTALYIPQARGNIVELPDGRRVPHDGYFVAADTGGLIKGDHIDVFIGIAKSNPFPWVKSTLSGKFDAFVVENQAIKNALVSHSVDPSCAGPGKNEPGCLLVTGESLNQNIRVGTPVTFSGWAGVGVETVELAVDGWSLGSVSVSDQAFSLNYRFSGAGVERFMEAIGRDANGNELTRKSYFVTVER